MLWPTEPVGPPFIFVLTGKQKVTRAVHLIKHSQSKPLIIAYQTNKNYSIIYAQCRLDLPPRSVEMCCDLSRTANCNMNENLTAKQSININRVLCWVLWDCNMTHCSQPSRVQAKRFFSFPFLHNG